MTDTIEVKPRYFEPEAPNQQAAPAAVALAKSDGLFTSIYENRIIVFIIVATIIIIAFIAYVVYSRDPVEPKPGGYAAQQQAAAAQQTPQNQQQAAAAQQTPQNQQQAAAVQQNQQQPAQQPAKPANNLEELLTRSRRVEAENNQSAQVMNMKSEEEIMHLMEDKSGSAEETTITSPK